MNPLLAGAVVVDVEVHLLGILDGGDGNQRGHDDRQIVNVATV
jgi:hypothetical protein